MRKAIIYGYSTHCFKQALFFTKFYPPCIGYMGDTKELKHEQSIHKHKLLIVFQRLQLRHNSVFSSLPRPTDSKFKVYDKTHVTFVPL